MILYWQLKFIFGCFFCVWEIVKVTKFRPSRFWIRLTNAISYYGYIIASFTLVEAVTWDRPRGLPFILSTQCSKNTTHND